MKKNPERETVEKLNDCQRKAVGLCACCEHSTTDQGYHRIVAYNRLTGPSHAAAKAQTALLRHSSSAHICLFL